MMALLLQIARRIDRASERLGTLCGWLTLSMVLLGAYNALARYLDRHAGWGLSANAYLEGQNYLFSIVFLLGGVYALRTGAHVRVDVVFGRISARARLWVDLVGTIGLLMPFCAFTLWMSWPVVLESWRIREQSPDPGGLARYPIKAVMALAFALLIIQATSELIKLAAQLAGRRDPAAESGPERS
jgi:TRAP-type mannitol/chloroaromatic compound transport system permease small subunit